MSGKPDPLSHSRAGSNHKPKPTEKLFHFAATKAVVFGFVGGGIGLGCIFLALSHFAQHTSILYAFPVGIFFLWAAFLVVIRKNLRIQISVWSLVVIVVVTAAIRYWSGLDCEGFDVTAVASTYQPRRSLERVNIWYAHHTEDGPTISPAQELVYFRIVNTQPYVSTIRDYNVVLRTSWFGRVQLSRMNLQSGQLLIGPEPDNSQPRGNINILGNVPISGQSSEPGHTLSVLDVRGSALDNLLASHPIQPHETVQGWAVFEAPGADLKYLVDARLIITIEDDAGQTFSCELPARPKQTVYQESTALENAVLKVLPQTVDIRSFHRAFFSEYYPQ